MNKKEKRISLFFSIFLFLCAIINLAGGQIGAAICSLGAGIFFVSISSATHEEIIKGGENKR